MIRNDKVKFADGSIKTHIRVVKSYRPAPGMTPRQATIKSFGYLEDHPDPQALLEEVKAFDYEQKIESRQKSILISIPLSRKNNDIQNRKFNYGYRYLESIYTQLGIDTFFDRIPFKGNYRLNDVFEFLVFKRILNPNSKRGTFQEIRHFYNKNYGFSLPQVYRALDHFSDVSIKLQKKLNDQIKTLIGRDQSYAFYDVTNYYFETDLPGNEGDYQQKGVSKEHRLSPIVQLGLFIDSNHLPIAMSLFPGNTADCKTLQPIMREIKDDYRLGRLVVVADKGLNTQANIDYIVSQGDGYVVSQVLRGPKGKRYQDMLLDPEGYVFHANYKYKLFEEEYESKVTRNKTITYKRKVLIFWSKEESDYAKKKRDAKVRRAAKRITNNAYRIDHSAGEYVTTKNILKATGEISDQAVHKIDYKKIEEEEKLDGYFCIITSELDYDYKKILEVYGGLWRIEESFRISKSDLEVRPIRLRTQKHIEGHMLICYVALLLLRLLQYQLGSNEISAHRIKQTLNACTCTLPSQEAVLIDEVGGKRSFKEVVNKNGEIVESLAFDEGKDQIQEDYKTIQEAFGVKFDHAASTRASFNKFMKSIKFKPRKQAVTKKD